MARKKTRTAKLEALAKEFVTNWIANGCMTYEMNDHSASVQANFAAMLTREIRAFAETGKVTA